MCQHRHSSCTVQGTQNEEDHTFITITTHTHAHTHFCLYLCLIPSSSLGFFLLCFLFLFPFSHAHIYIHTHSFIWIFESLKYTHTHTNACTHAQPLPRTGVYLGRKTVKQAEDSAFEVSKAECCFLDAQACRAQCVMKTLPVI